MYATGQWLHRHRQMRLIRAFKQGLAPTVIGLLIATGTIMASAGAATPDQWPVWLIAAVATLLVWRTRVHILWLLGAGALAGAFFLT
jgi:chromate transporter